ncbi:MAG: hypothetical protein AB8H47_14035 [Bacteroidia bacterium]
MDTNPYKSEKLSYWGVLGLFLLLSITACDTTPENFVVRAADVPLCTTAKSDLFDYIETQTLGVEGFNPEDHYIGRFPAERYVNINNWRPLSSFKKTLRGRLHHFNVYDGMGDEMDWNNFVIPAPEFQNLIDEALPYKGGAGFWCRDDGWHDCDGTDDCLEAEITPDQRFYQNPWFPKSPDDSPLEGKDICFYGPWVRECFHGHRPEIHPSELIWWRDKWGDADLFWLMAMLDDSNRFDENNEFDNGGQSFPSSWRPWAKPPLTARFRIPFEVSTSAFGSRMNFSIGESFAHNIVTQEDPSIRKDADDGKVHVLEYEGRELVTVTELQSNDSHIGVQFVDLCRTSNNKLKGFVQILTRMGKGIDDQEGYHVLYVIRDDKPGLIPEDQLTPEQPLTYMVKAEGESDSLDIVRDQDGLSLMGNLQIRVISDYNRKEAVPSITSIRKQGKNLYFAPIANSKHYRLKGVSLFEPAVFDISFADEHQEKVKWQGIGMTPLLEAKSVSSGKARPLNQSLLLKEVGMKSENRSSSLQEVEESLWTLKALPIYAPYRNGALSLEEGNPFSKTLNRYLQEKSDTWTRSFGQKQPFQFKWTFEAKDLSTGKTIAVKSVSATGGNTAAIQIEYVKDPLTNSLLQIHFPEKLQDHLLQLVAKVEIIDPYNNVSSFSQTIWNHSLRSPQKTDLYAAVKAELPIWTQQEKLRAQAVYQEKVARKLRDNSIPESADDRRAEQILMEIQHVSADGRIDLPELRNLQSGVMYWSQAER